jgi:hypothetical protein
MRLPFSLVLFIIAHSSEGILIKEFYDDLSPQACAAECGDPPENVGHSLHSSSLLSASSPSLYLNWINGSTLFHHRLVQKIRLCSTCLFPDLGHNFLIW